MFSTGLWADEEATKTLIDRISRAKSELTTVEKTINTESTQYARRLEKKQDQIRHLRDQAAAVQRLADEKLLGLGQLEARVDQWTTQSHYQQSLLISYVEGTRLDINSIRNDDGELDVDARILGLALQRVESLLKPEWHNEELISADGKLTEMQRLSLGPLNFAVTLQGDVGGPLQTAFENEARVLGVYSADDLLELKSLKDTGAGYLSFDPTLGNAYELLNYDNGVMSHVKKGGLWAIPIILFGALSLLVALLKGLQLLRLPTIDRSLSGKITQLLSENKVDEIHALRKQVGAPQAGIVNIVMSSPVSERRDDLLVAYLMEYKHQIERFMGVVATSAAIAPLLGLLGTVSGMINTFKMMTIFGTGDASTVSGGISEALITTELGLVVAIPSLIVSALMSRKTRSYNHQLETTAVKLSKIQFPDQADGQQQGRQLDRQQASQT